MLVHCYPVVLAAATAVARPFRRTVHRAVGSGARKPHHGAATIAKPAVIGEVCRRVAGALPAGLGAFAPAAVGAALAGLAGAGLGPVGGGGLPAGNPTRSEVVSETGSGLGAGGPGGLVQGVPGELSFMSPASSAQAPDQTADAAPVRLLIAGLGGPEEGASNPTSPASGPRTGIGPGLVTVPGASMPQVPQVPFTPGRLPAQSLTPGEFNRSNARAVTEPATLLVLAVGGLAAVVACRSGRRIG